MSNFPLQIKCPFKTFNETWLLQPVYFLASDKKAKEKKLKESEKFTENIYVVNIHNLIIKQTSQ